MRILMGLAALAALVPTLILAQETPKSGGYRDVGSAGSGYLAAGRGRGRALIDSTAGRATFAPAYSDLNANQKGISVNLGGCVDGDYDGATSPNVVTSAITGCVYIPAGIYKGIESWPDNGIAGFAVTANPKKAAVGVTGTGGIAVANGHAYGGNFSVVNCRLYAMACGHGGGLDFTNQYAGEFDVNLYTKSGGAMPLGRSTGVVVQLNSDVGITAPGVLNAYNIVADPGTHAQFRIGYATEDNAAAVGVYLAANSHAAVSASQSLQFSSVFARGAHISSLQSNATGQLVIKGYDGIKLVGPVALQGYLTLATYTVATLPPCIAKLAGAYTSVSDASAPTYNGPLTGGGSEAIPVFCNGTSWRAH